MGGAICARAPPFAPPCALRHNARALLATSESDAYAETIEWHLTSR